MPPVVEELDHAFDVEGNGEKGFDGVDLETAGRELGRRCERAGVGPVGLTLHPPLFTRVDEGDHFDIGIVDVGADVQVVDPPEPDEGRPNRSVVRSEGHGVVCRLLPALAVTRGPMVVAAPSCPATHALHAAGQAFWTLKGT